MPSIILATNQSSVMTGFSYCEGRAGHNHARHITGFDKIARCTPLACLHQVLGKMTSRSMRHFPKKRNNFPHSLLPSIRSDAEFALRAAREKYASPRGGRQSVTTANTQGNPLPSLVPTCLTRGGRSALPPSPHPYSPSQHTTKYIKLDEVRGMRS